MEQDVKRIVFWKLKPEYETIHIRCTQLENFVNPPLYTITDEAKREKTFKIWHLVHEILEKMSIWWQYMHAVKELQAFNEKETNWIVDNINQYAVWLKKADITGNVDVIEKTYIVEIECSWYLVVLQWTIDTALKNWVIFDYKTAKALYKEEDVLKKRQKKYYVFLKNIVEWTEKDMFFNYFVVTKHKKAQHWIYENYIRYDDAYRTLRKDLYLYLKHLANEDKNPVQDTSEEDYE